MSEKMYNKFTVIKNEDLDRLSDDDSNTFHFIVEEMAEADLEKEYLVVNRDEPYAKLVEKLILREGCITEKGVTWQEAFEAGLNGKKIKVYGQYLTYPKFETLHFALNYLSIRPTYYQDMLKKEWYIEQD